MASGKSDEVKGRVKEAAGALTGNKKLKREGKADQAVGKIKQNVEKVIDKVKEECQTEERTPASAEDNVERGTGHARRGSAGCKAR